MSIRRYGDIILPMDETLIMCAIDLSGRPYLGFESTFTADSVGYFDTQMVKEFFYAITPCPFKAPSRSTVCINCAPASSKPLAIS